MDLFSYCHLPSLSDIVSSMIAGVRPVPLDIHVQGFDIANFESRMQAMARPAYSALVSHATDARPAIVFVPTRKHARLTAMDLLAFAAADGLPTRFLQVRCTQDRRFTWSSQVPKFVGCNQRQSLQGRVDMH